MTPALHEACYTIHGNVTVRIETRNAGHIEWFDVFFRQFRSVGKNAGQVYRIVDYSRFDQHPDQLPARAGVVDLDSGFWIPGLRYAVTIESGGITEYTDMTDMQATLLWLQVLLHRQDLSLLHSASIGLYGKCVVFPGLSGCGKTLLSLLLKDRPDYSFFSDEYTIIGTDGTVYANPCDLTIFPIHAGLVPGLLSPGNDTHFLEREKAVSRIRCLEKIPCPSFLRWMKNAGISTLMKHKVPPSSLKIPVGDVIPQKKQGTTARVTTAILLTRYHGPSIRFLKMDLPEYIQMVAGITNLDFRKAWNLLHMASACGAGEGIPFEQRQRDILSRAFSRVELFEARLPYDVDPAVFAREIERFLDPARK